MIHSKKTHEFQPKGDSTGQQIVGKRKLTGAGVGVGGRLDGISVVSKFGIAKFDGANVGFDVDGSVGIAGAGVLSGTMGVGGSGANVGFDVDGSVGIVWSGVLSGTMGVGGSGVR